MKRMTRGPGKVTPRLRPITAPPFPKPIDSRSFRNPSWSFCWNCCAKHGI